MNGTNPQVCKNCRHYSGRMNLHIRCILFSRGYLLPADNPPSNCPYIADHQIELKIWLDDERKEPEGYVREKTVEACIEHLKLGHVKHINFDHDLGTKLTGYDLALWIEKEANNNADFRVPSFRIQSANVVGSQNIEAAMKNARKMCKNPIPDLNWWEEKLL